MRKKNKKVALRKPVFIGIIIVLIAVAMGFYFHQKNTDKSNLAGNIGKTPVTGTTSKPTGVQLPTNTSAGQSGGVVDNNGQTNGNLPPSSQWVSSSSGNITLQQPSPNSVVKSGDTLSGTAKVSNVQFILTDNSIGLIAQGNLNIINGKFSGKLQFTPHSNNGKLEVYYPNPANGAEEDIVEINVSFNAQ
jgi:hypothetical protein